MSADLGSLLSLAAVELSPSDGLDAAHLSRVVRSVRRRRIRRHTVESAVGVAAASVVGTVVWAGLRLAPEPHRAPPAVTATPTVQPTPAPTVQPSAIPRSTPSAAPVADDIVGLPPTFAMPAGLLEKTTPGWVLAIYQSEVLDENSRPVPSVPTVVLSSPEGVPYRVHDLPLNPSIDVRLLRWDAGSSTALVSVGRSLAADGSSAPSGLMARGVLDLTTGTITPDQRGLSDAAGFVGKASSGAELWMQPTDLSVVDQHSDDDLLSIDGDRDAKIVATLKGAREFDVNPTGTRAVFTSYTPGQSDSMGTVDSLGVVDLQDGRATVAPFIQDKRCQISGWIDAESVLTACNGDSDAHPSVWSIDVASRTPTHLRDLAEGDAWPDGGTWLSDGVTIGSGHTGGIFGDDDCVEGGVYTWKAGVPTLVASALADREVYATVVDGTVYITDVGSCYGGPTIVSSRPVDGDPITLLPAPSPRPDGEAWSSGATSWTVGRPIGAIG